MDAEQEKEGIEKGGFVLFLALVTLALLVVIAPFLSPLLWAMLAAIMFQPMYQWFLSRRPGKDNQAAIATLLVIFFAVIIPTFLVGSVVVEQAAGVVKAFREGNFDVTGWVDEIYSALPSRLRTELNSSGLTDLTMLQQKAQDFLKESAGLIAQQAVAIGGSAFGFVLAFGVCLYVTYFLLRDGTKIGEAVLRGLPLDRHIADRLAERFLGIVRATIKGSVVVGIVQGILGALTFWIVGMPSVVLLGLLMAIFSLLPAVGTGIIWVPVAVWLLATGSIWEGVVVIISGVAVIGMADNVLRPILVGRDTGIPDWIILVTTLGGIATLGLSGIVLGPVVAGLFLAGWSILQEHHQTHTALPDAGE
ncbi:MAG: AI-2E family transporter [Sphingomonadaceae bacterium]|nr:AI-2E family transporter [Sphingomonadaceae bacterium]